MKLLSHPLVTYLLRYKWRSFGRGVYYSRLILYVIFLFFLTGYAIVTAKVLPTSLCNSSVCVCNITFGKVQTGSEMLWRSIGRPVILTTTSISLFLEVRYLSYERFSDHPISPHLTTALSTPPTSSYPPLPTWSHSTPPHLTPTHSTIPDPTPPHLTPTHSTIPDPTPPHPQLLSPRIVSQIVKKISCCLILGVSYQSEMYSDHLTPPHPTPPHPMG